MTEFYDKPAAAPLGDPAADRPMTVRVHPDDDPRDPKARRAIRVAGVHPWPWVQVTGVAWEEDCEDGMWWTDDEVATWPVTHPIQYCTAFRHAAASAAREGRTAQPAERGDLDVSAFRGGDPE